MPMLEQSLQLEVGSLNEEVVAKNGVNFIVTLGASPTMSILEHLRQR